LIPEMLPNPAESAEAFRLMITVRKVNMQACEPVVGSAAVAWHELQRALSYCSPFQW
jgi:hypothetical protein